MLAFQLLRRRVPNTARAGCPTRQRKEWDMNSVVEPNVKKQHGRSSPLLPLLGRRPHIVVLSGTNDTKCDLETKTRFPQKMETKTRLVGRSRGIHVNKY